MTPRGRERPGRQALHRRPRTSLPAPPSRTHPAGQLSADQPDRRSRQPRRSWPGGGAERRDCARSHDLLPHSTWCWNGGVDVLSSRILLRPGDLDRSRRFYRDLLGLAIYREFGPPTIPGGVLPRPGVTRGLRPRAGPARPLGDDLDPDTRCPCRVRPAGCGRSPGHPGAGRRAVGLDRNVDRGSRRHPDRPGRGSRRSPSAPWPTTGVTAKVTNPDTAAEYAPRGCHSHRARRPCGQG